MVRLWILLYFLFSILMLITAICLFYRERIKKFIYGTFRPEELVKVVLFYPNSMFKEFYRLIPSDNQFTISGKIYAFDSKETIKPNDFFIKNKNATQKIIIDGNEYDYFKDNQIKRRWNSETEIHYFFNNPTPIKYETSKKAIELNGHHLEQLKQNDLFGKLLSLQDQNKMLMFVIILVVLNTLISGFVLAKTMGWLK